MNLGYVLNVIEDIQERTQTLRAAWQLCRRVLVVAARIAVGDGGHFGAAYGDGVLTRLGTFHKLYTDDLAGNLNQRRFDLIQKRYSTGLDRAEEIELTKL